MEEEALRLKAGKFWVLLFDINSEIFGYDNFDAVACFQRIIAKYPEAKLLDLQAFQTKTEAGSYAASMNHAAKLRERFGLTKAEGGKRYTVQTNMASLSPDSPDPS